MKRRVLSQGEVVQCNAGGEAGLGDMRRWNECYFDVVWTGD